MVDYALNEIMVMYLLHVEWLLSFVWPGELKDVAVQQNAWGSYNSTPKWPAQGTEREKRKETKKQVRENNVLKLLLP